MNSINRKIYSFLFASCLLVFSQCERQKDIDFELPFTEDKPVVYALISPNGAKAMALRTVAPLEGYDREKALLTDAKVKVIANQMNYALQYDAMLAQHSCSFSPEFPSGTLVYIEMESVYPMITSEKITIPEKVFIDSYKILYSTDSAVADVSFYFTDDPSVRNYYFTEILLFSEGELITANSRTLKDSFLPHIISPDTSFTGSNFIFNEKVKIETAYIDPSKEPAYQKIKIDSMKFILHNGSESIFNFIKRNHEITNQLGGWTENMAPYSNIKNGYGIIGASNSDTLTVSF